MPSKIAVIIPVYNTGKKKLTKCILIITVFGMSAASAM